MPDLLLYLTANDDLHRVAVAPTLAALAARAGIGFECCYDRPARGRHFGGGPVSDETAATSGGSPFAAGPHARHLRRLADRFRLLLVGDPAGPAWATAADAGAAVLAATRDPAGIYAAVLPRLGLDCPDRVQVLDAQPQGPAGVVTAPYLAAALLAGPPALGVDVTADTDCCAALRALGVRRFTALWVDGHRAAGFPEPLPEAVGGDLSSYAAMTADLARAVDGQWRRGVLLADPDLTAAQVARIAARRLVPLFGEPQVTVIERAADVIAAADEPVFGRQYDDRDFVELARLGHGLQVVDPGPPFEAMRGLGPPPPAAPAPDEPSDEQLREWARGGKVLTTLCLWAGMIREIDGLDPLAALALDTGLRAGLVVTADTAELSDAVVGLAAPPERGGTAGRLEPLLGSTGRGVAAEQLMDVATLGASVQEALAAFAGWPAALRPQGWWPLLDTALVPRPARVAVRDGLPRVLFTPRADATTDDATTDAGPDRTGGPARPDLRRVGGEVVRRTGADRMLRARRPFDDARPGGFEPAIGRAVAAAGLRFMFTKAAFGTTRPAWRDGEFVAVPFTAGSWDGWSPFWTVSDVRQVRAAERRLTRTGRPGWLVSTVDTPLFALPGEVWEHGARLHAIASYVAGPGRSGRLVNVTPRTVARYARLLADEKSP